MSYDVAEVFYSLQGEGRHTGSPTVFVRFAGCNLSCSMDTAGFNCDTDHECRKRLELDELVALVRRLDSGDCRRVTLTGGEPLLQVDERMVVELFRAGYQIAVETNGTVKPGFPLRSLHWISCSPKRGQPVVIGDADELRVVLAAGGSPEQHAIDAPHKYVSPAADGNAIPRANLDWCIRFCLEHPRWSLSVQSHKQWGIR